MKYIITVLLSCMSLMAVGQEALRLQEDSLRSLADTIRLCKDDEVRIETADVFLEKFEALLRETPQSFSYAFDSLTSIAKVYPADSTFRIMTWQLYVDKNTYKYFGIIQHQKNPSNIIVLNDFSKRIRQAEHKELNAENWYGALYYDIQAFKTKKEKKYALFGYNAHTFYEKRKVMDILSFDPEGEPTFGAPLIEHTIRKRDVPPKTETYHRFILEYPSDVVASIKYNDAQKMVLFDHLIPVPSTFPDIPIVMVPDGSYEGFQWKKGKWKHVEKVFHQMLDEAPRPSPLFNQKKKKKKRDLFGRSTN